VLPGVTWFGDWSSGSVGGCNGATRGETRGGALRRREDRSRRNEKLDGLPGCGEGSWPGGSRGATRGETRGETLGGPERSPPGEGGGGAVGGPDASIDRIDL